MKYSVVLSKEGSFLQCYQSQFHNSNLITDIIQLLQLFELSCSLYSSDAFDMPCSASNFPTVWQSVGDWL